MERWNAHPLLVKALPGGPSSQDYIYTDGYKRTTDLQFRAVELGQTVLTDVVIVTNIFAAVRQHSSIGSARECDFWLKALSPSALKRSNCA